MIKVSNSLPDIAVLRGGKKEFQKSLKEGGEVLSSLTRIGYQPLDVLIDREGTWTAKGSPTDAHAIFTQAHTVVDTTRMKGEKYHDLAKKMGIPLLFSAGNEVSLDREDIYRLLRQQGVKVPDTLVVRAKAPLPSSFFRDVWSRYHTPLLVRPLQNHDEAPSRLIRQYGDLENIIREYHGKGIDVHVLTYRKTHTSSIAVLPYFRNERIYTPLWVDTFPEGDGIPTRDAPMRPHLQAPEFKKENMKAFAMKVYDALGLSVPVCIDLITHNKQLIVVNVDINPSMHQDSRFMQSLHTTGVNAGHYVHSCIHNDLKR
jgi:D-alanine-D-alanine ligase-like ATP-grasp enzyme